MAELLERLAEVIHELAALDLRAVDDETLSGLVEGLHRQVARLDAATTRTVRVWDARRAWEHDGARTGAAWLAWKCRLPETAARARVRLARALRQAPVTERAWLAGDITGAHVQALVGANREATAADFARDEALLVEQATTLWHRHFLRALHCWEQLADPDGVEDVAARQRERRRAHLSQTFRGMWVGGFELDPLAGAAVHEVWSRITEELLEEDWAEARARLGDGATASDLPWLDDAYVERVVFDGPSRVIDVGAQRRLFDGATRRAIEVRDRWCYHETCDLPADACEADHVEPWRAGGRTVQLNGRLACGFHNRARERRT